MSADRTRQDANEPRSRRAFLEHLAATTAAGVCGVPAVSRAGAPPHLGLDFPGSAAVRRTMRFRFLDPLSIYPATYIWSAYPRRQAGYYTALFWGNDDGKGDLRTFLWTPSGDADSYYGAHPYPSPRPHGTNHHWEISVVQDDFVNGAVEYDRWHRQALRVWADRSGKYHEFYWDLPFTDRKHRVSHKAPPAWGNRMPPVPTLTWGDAPWAPGKEVWNGVLRGIQVYERCLTVGDILRESRSPRSTPAGAASLWYLNLDPTPDDLSDKSGRGHHPAWVGDERPQLWTGTQPAG
ncbi:twin-arginine translocation signal domain-containing protein [Piscinibacter sp. XHJ-5]|uniref:twin-arginine translocation signal domain-containing protein n=1 Tax=Piscinibacter sp. XHJ-5 TaxID=3037797 RepID=UPI0024530E63|nr:twin-arginine translocation signal domain-containing protein [Piscinibacter sp. XHJ-5]